MNKRWKNNTQQATKLSGKNPQIIKIYPKSNFYPKNNPDSKDKQHRIAHYTRGKIKISFSIHT